MALDDGFYWIKLNLMGGWIIARYSSEVDEFYLTGVEEIYTPSEIYLVNEERILPPQN